VKLEPQSVFGGLFGAASRLSQFKSERAILRERSDIGCVLLTVAAEGPEATARASRACNLELPLAPGAVTMTAGRTALWLTPRSWLIHCDLLEEDDLLERIAEAFPDRLAHGALFTDAVCWFELFGPAALDLLAEGGFVSLERGGLPVGHAKRTLIAQVAVVLIRQAEDSWLLAVERSRSTYFVQWLSAAAEARE
jgi:heterotetrameric sarcosine oxidase gamma subunit